MKSEIIVGLKPVEEALKGKRKAFELFASDSRKDLKVEAVITAAERADVPVRRRVQNDITKIAGTSHHQGVALRLEPFNYAEFSDLEKILPEKSGNDTILILDGIQDPHNLGAIIRTAACSGTACVVIPKDRAAAVTAIVEKVSAGAVETVPIVRVSNISEAIDSLKKIGYWIFGAVGEAESSLYEADFKCRCAVVIGNEGDGIRPLVKSKCDFLISIPLAGGVSSLNASVAAGVILFEIARKKFFSSKAC